MNYKWTLRLLVACLLSLLVGVAGPTYGQGRSALYAIFSTSDGSNTQKLYTIETGTGAATFIADLEWRTNSAIGLTADPVSGFLVTYARYEEGFVAIDPADGTKILLQPATWNGTHNLAFDFLGTLYVFDGIADVLAKFDLVTGERDVIGSIAAYDFGGGLTFNSSGELFFLGEHQWLVQVDPSDASTMVVAELGQGVWAGMDFDENDTLFAARRSPLALYTIDSDTGDSTLMTSIVGAEGVITAIAFAGGDVAQVRSFTWPTDPTNSTRGHDGPCGDWKGTPTGCFWLSDTAEMANRVWRDAQPFQRHFNSAANGYHLGADYNLGGGGADRGEKVYAIAVGEVVNVLTNVCGWGNIIFVLHETSYGPVTSMYAHVDWLDDGPPSVGDLVSSTTPIAEVGNGAWDCGPRRKGRYLPHLHLEIREGFSTAPGRGYSSAIVVVGPEGQIDPNAFISAQQ